MKRQSILVWSLVIAGTVWLGDGPALAADEHEIVGSPKCRICHRAKTGDQWQIWLDSAHARAYETLASDESQKIAEEQGLGDPQQEEECLRCHATHAFLGRDVPLAERNKYEDAEGVGCEACHGPGSDYKKKSVMEDREKALAAGLVLAKNTEHCELCHNEESPTYVPFDFETRWQQIAHPVKTDQE